METRTKHTDTLLQNPQFFILLICIQRSFIIFQGYEGSLLKVTSKNGKTSSVSIQRPIFHKNVTVKCKKHSSVIHFPAGGFCDFQHESRCWSSQARSSGERPTLFSKRLKHMMKWDFGTSELLRWYHLSRTFVIASELWWFFCFASLQQSTYKVVIKLLLQKTRLRNIFLKV